MNVPVLLVAMIGLALTLLCLAGCVGLWVWMLIGG